MSFFGLKNDEKGVIDSAHAQSDHQVASRSTPHVWFTAHVYARHLRHPRARRGKEEPCGVLRHARTQSLTNTSKSALASAAKHSTGAFAAHLYHSHFGSNSNWGKMKQDKLQEEAMKILDEASDCRKLLEENYQNFMNVADYCCKNYVESGPDSSRALEETKTFTAQSLASIAYQISTLATSMLSLLDVQTDQLGRMESAVNLIEQTVEMHREKVSRREIGAFTAVRRVPRGPKISPPPPRSQPRPPYDRRPISYQQLDDLGHGVKLSGKEREGTFRKATSSIRCSKSLATEGLKSPLAPSSGSSTFGKPVAPPTVPLAPVENHVLAPPLEEVPPPPPPPPDSPSLDHQMTLEPLLPPLETPPTDLFLPLTPPPCLETVLEEISLPPPSPPPVDLDHGFSLPSNEEPELPAPPPTSQEVDASLPTRGSGVGAVRPPAARSVSLRVRSGPASRRRPTRSLFLPAVQSLMIPPPPTYPPPHAPPQPWPSSPSSHRLSLPARLQHLDLELLTLPPPPPPPPPLDDQAAAAPPNYLEKVVALYDYEGAKPGDLSLRAGDVVYVTHRHDNSWYEGVMGDRRGFFPDNYVQTCD
ncbi:ABI family, member 3a isoform X2 [Stigmatopora argus]